MGHPAIRTTEEVRVNVTPGAVYERHQGCTLYEVIGPARCVRSGAERVVLLALDGPVEGRMILVGLADLLVSFTPYEPDPENT